MQHDGEGLSGSHIDYVADGDDIDNYQKPEGTLIDSEDLSGPID
jgi:hypothetical protein